jgi:hypothetical protein
LKLLNLRAQCLNGCSLLLLCDASRREITLQSSDVIQTRTHGGLKLTLTLLMSSDGLLNLSLQSRQRNTNAFYLIKRRGTIQTCTDSVDILLTFCKELSDRIMDLNQNTSVRVEHLHYPRKRLSAER